MVKQNLYSQLPQTWDNALIIIKRISVFPFQMRNALQTKQMISHLSLKNGQWALLALKAESCFDECSLVLTGIAREIFK